MPNPIRIRDRYMRDDLPIRLGGIAANLSRIYSFSDDTDSHDIVSDLIEETGHFIEWTKSDAGISIQTASELTQLTKVLREWAVLCSRNWLSESCRSQLSAQACEWSQRVVLLSGLLNRQKPA